MLYGNIWLPIFLIVQYWQAYCSRWINVRMWKHRFKHTFWWPYWEIIGEVHRKWVLTSLPGWIFWSGYDTVPFEKIGWSILTLDWFCDKSKRMVASPIFSFLFEPVYHEFVDLFFHDWKFYNWLWKYLILRVILLTVYFQKYLPYFWKIIKFVNFN